jgi:hypothetical protein
MTQSPQFVPIVTGEVNRHIPGTESPTKYRTPLEIRTTPINFTNVDLTLGYRNGAKFVLPKQYDAEKYGLIIRTDVLITSLVEIHAEYALSVPDEHSSAELMLIKDAIRNIDQSNPYRRGNFGGLNLSFDYQISIEQIKDHGGVIYLEEVDLVVSLLSQEKTPAHPYSKEGIHQTACGGLDAFGGGQFGYAIEIVDTLGKIGDRYLNIGGRIHRIPTQVNPTRLDGIYIRWNQWVENEYALAKEHSERYDPEEADERFQLYRGYAEAVRAGDRETVRKEELAELEHETAKMKHAHSIEKAQYETKNLEMEQRIKELLHQMEMREKDRAEKLSQLKHEHEVAQGRIRDYYESRSLDRKDSSEVIKILPTLAVGLGAIFLAVKTLL